MTHCGAPDPAATRWEVEGSLLGCRGVLERLLLGNLLPFWYPHTVDCDSGGFRLNHDIKGHWRGPVPKHIVTQARATWFFATLASTRYGAPAHLEAAAHGYRFLTGPMWDQVHGGFYWETDPCGESVVQDGKHLYGQSFGLYALSAYAMATGDGAALGRAAEVFELLERHAHDVELGGYREDLLRNWRPRAGKARGELGASPGQKTLNTHLHLLEAITEYFRASGDAMARARALELLFLLSGTVLRRGPHRCGDRYERDWSPIQGTHNQRVSYGHDLELLWLMEDSCRALGISGGALKATQAVLFESAWQLGYDHRYGGFFHEGAFGRAADRREKIWWVQAEALTASLIRYVGTGASEAALCFVGTLEWIVSRQVDWTHGEWYARIDGLRTSGDKAGMHWKGPYHNGRALLRCLELLGTVDHGGALAPLAVSGGESTMSPCPATCAAPARANTDPQHSVTRGPPSGAYRFCRAGKQRSGRQGIPQTVSCFPD